MHAVAIPSQSVDAKFGMQNAVTTSSFANAKFGMQNAVIPSQFANAKLGLHVVAPPSQSADAKLGLHVVAPPSPFVDAEFGKQNVVKLTTKPSVAAKLTTKPSVFAANGKNAFVALTLQSVFVRPKEFVVSGSPSVTNVAVLGENAAFGRNVVAKLTASVPATLTRKLQSAVVAPTTKLLVNVEFTTSVLAALMARLFVNVGSSVAAALMAKLFVIVGSSAVAALMAKLFVVVGKNVPVVCTPSPFAAAGENELAALMARQFAVVGKNVLAALGLFVNVPAKFGLDLLESVALGLQDTAHTKL